PNSWRHISSDIVKQAVLRNRLEQAVSKVASSDDASAYEELLQEASENLNSKDAQIQSLREELEEKSASLEQAEAQADALKHALGGVQSRTTDPSDQIAGVITPLREALINVL